MSTIPTLELNARSFSIFPPRLSFDGLLTGLLGLVTFTIAALMPMQNDSWWHLRVGEEIWRRGEVPNNDYLSFTIPENYYWPDHEWLAQVLAWGVYSLGRLPLLTICGAVLITIGVMITYALTRGPAIVTAGLMTLAMPILLMGWCVRPHAFTFLFLPLLVWLLVRERYRWLPVVFFIWANVHGAVVMGGLVMVLACLTALLFDRKRLPILMLWTLLCGGATLLTPLGFYIFQFPFDSIHRSHTVKIEEWRSLGLRLWPDALIWVFLAAFCGLFLWKWTQRKDWSDRLLGILAIILIPVTLTGIRNSSFFLLLAVPAASRLLSNNPSRRPLEASAANITAVPQNADIDPQLKPLSQNYDNPRMNFLVVAILAVFSAAFITWDYLTLLPKLDWQPMSPEAIRTLRSLPGPIYNHYNDGGYILFFAPGHKVFIDSREDPYPIDFLLTAMEAEKTGNCEPLFTRWGIRSAVVPPKSKTGQRMSERGWRTEYKDERWWMLTDAAQFPASTSAPGKPAKAD